MDIPLHKALNEAVIKLIRPLVRVLLNHGMSHGTFSELSRRVFVEEGFAHESRAGRRPTVSKISALTGLSRKEVKRLKELDPDELDAPGKRRNRAIRVISGWVNDPVFQSAGEPRVLPLEGEGPSFADLVKKYSGDVPTVAMLSLLLDAGNIAQDDEQITLVKQAYIPMSTPVDLLNILGTDTAELIETIGHNIESEPAERRFQRKVSTALVHKDSLAKFREMSDERSQKLLEEYDAWLSRHEVNELDRDQAAYVAVGIYYVEHTE